MSKTLKILLSTLLFTTLSCSTLNNETFTRALHIGTTIASIYFPEVRILSALCTASGTRDTELISSALQSLLENSSVEQNRELTMEIIDLKNSVLVKDETSISNAQVVLGSVCCSTGRCQTQ